MTWGLVGPANNSQGNVPLVTWPPQYLPLHLSSSSPRVFPLPRAPHVSHYTRQETSLTFPNTPMPFYISRNYPHPIPLSFSSYVTVVYGESVPVLNRPPEFRHVEVTNITFQWSELATLDTCRGTDAPRTLSFSRSLYEAPFSNSLCPSFLKLSLSPCVQLPLSLRVSDMEDLCWRFSCNLVGNFSFLFFGLVVGLYLASFGCWEK